MIDKASIDMYLTLISSSDTEYRLRPNPDLPPEVGATEGGLVLEWRDQGESEWKGYFYLPPEVCHALPEALAKFGFGEVAE